MYCEFYGLKEEPFSITPDPGFLFFSKKHEEAFFDLLYGIKSRRGFMEITGSIGSGKTTLYRALLEQLGDGVKSALIINPSLSPVQLLQTIMEDFKLEVKTKSRKGYFDALNNFLMDLASAGSTALLILDEAQNLKPTTLEQIRLLSNFETNKCKLLQILLVGQPELRDLLAKPSLIQIKQRIAVSTHLTSLSREETEKYVAHRINVAGGKGMLIFDKAAVDEIFHYSQGIPRLINVICDKALLIAYLKKTKRDMRSVIQEAALRQSIPNLPG